MESELSDDGKASFMSEEEEDEEEEAPPRSSRPRRSSIGLRVAFQFPTKKPAKNAGKNSSPEPLFSGSHIQDSKGGILGRKTSCRQRKEREDSASESEDDSRDEGQESSDALLKRTMNIEENKAMVRPRGPRQPLLGLPGLRPHSRCCFGFGQEVCSGHCGFFLFSWTPSGYHLISSGLGTETPRTIFSPLHSAMD